MIKFILNSKLSAPVLSPSQLADGWRVILNKPARSGLGLAPAQIILCFRAKDASGHPEWVTWLYNETSRACFKGAYYSNEAMALADFEARHG